MDRGVESQGPIKPAVDTHGWERPGPENEEGETGRAEDGAEEGDLPLH